MRSKVLFWAVFATLSGSCVLPALDADRELPMDSGGGLAGSGDRLRAGGGQDGAAAGGGHAGAGGEHSSNGGGIGVIVNEAGGGGGEKPLEGAMSAAGAGGTGEPVPQCSAVAPKSGPIAEIDRFTDGDVKIDAVDARSGLWRSLSSDQLPIVGDHLSFTASAKEELLALQFLSDGCPYDASARKALSFKVRTKGTVALDVAMLAAPVGEYLAAPSPALLPISAQIPKDTSAWTYVVVPLPPTPISSVVFRLAKGQQLELDEVGFYTDPRGCPAEQPPSGDSAGSICDPESLCAYGSAFCRCVEYCPTPVYVCQSANDPVPNKCPGAGGTSG